MDSKIGKENESIEISMKNMKQAVHFPVTSSALLTGADKKVSNVILSKSTFLADLGRGDGDN